MTTASGRSSRAYELFFKEHRTTRNVNYPTNTRTWAIALTAIALFVFSPQAWAQTTAPINAEEQRPRALHLFERGAYKDALEEARQTDDSWSLAVRARIALLAGEIENAQRFSALARERTTSDEDKNFATVASAKAMIAAGEIEAAEALLRARLSDSPQAHSVRLELGRLLINRGSRAEGEVLLNALAGFYNNGIVKTSSDIAVVSEAMALLGSFDDANYALQNAINKDKDNIDALVQWGFLLLDKYNTADAEATFSEVLGHTPDHPIALVGLARVEMQLSNDYGKIRGFLEIAESTFPKNKELLLTRAEVAIFDTDCDAARYYVDKVLDTRPADLEALTVKTACAYLDDDTKAYEKLRDRVLKLNPEYARVYTETARYAERAHRYVEVVKLNQQALEIRPNYPPALLGIGIGHSRIGNEDEAAEYLGLAADADPYNVRAFNMIELYEKTIPAYRFTPYDRYQIRAHRTEEKAINAIVPPLVDEALDLYSKKYGFEIHPYLAVELFPNPKTFSVRSVGLPNISPHGICFGRVVVSRSPSDGNFNWAQVMWHELAHVYHLQMSDSRVPRWFTEGLAEYETNVKDPSWIRHHDRELSRALLADELRGVLELSEGFTHARSFEEVLRAYHQSSLVIHYIVETWGFEVVPKMLQGWADRKETSDVMVAVLNTTPEKFDDGFKAWLGDRYANFRPQFMVNLATIPTATELEKRVHADPKDARSWAELAIARIRMGRVEQAQLAIERARQVAPTDSWVLVVSAMFAFDSGKIRDAYEFGRRALDSGADSYDLRIAMGTAGMALNDVEAAHIHFQSATMLWDGGIEAWRGLAKVASAREDAALAKQALMRQFALDQHDPVVARQVFEFGLEKDDSKLAMEGAVRWIHISPFDMRSQRAMTIAAAKVSDRKRAKQAIDTWLTLRPAGQSRILLESIAILSRAGLSDDAKTRAAQAKQAGAPKAKIDLALQGKFDSKR